MQLNFFSLFTVALLAAHIQFVDKLEAERKYSQNYFRNVWCVVGLMFGPFNERWFNFMLSSLKISLSLLRVLSFPCSTITYQYKFSTSNETNAFTTVYHSATHTDMHTHRTKQNKMDHEIPYFNYDRWNIHM